MTKTTGSIYALIACLFACTYGRCQADSKSGGNLSFAYIPITMDSGDMWIMYIPIKTNGRPLEGFVHAMCAPVYPASQEMDDRKQDINLISLANITLSFKGLEKDEEVHRDTDIELLIDLSRAKKPPGAKVELSDIVEALLIGVRMQYPPGRLTRVIVKIIGVPDPLKWTRLEGPLWPSMGNGDSKP